MKFAKTAVLVSAVLAFALLFSSFSQAKDIGEVSTTFNLLTPNDKIVVEAFQDPDVGGVVCYVSHAKKGGVAGTFGVATETSDASVACRQVGEIRFGKPLKGSISGDEVFNERHSILFKHMRIVRFVDKENNALVYLVYSDKLVDGSPKNSVSAVNIPLGNKIPVR